VALLSPLGYAMAASCAGLATLIVKQAQMEKVVGKQPAK